MQIELRPRSFGEILGLCFQLSVAHFGKLIVIVALLGIPNLLLSMWYTRAVFEATSETADPSAAAMFLPMTIVFLIAVSVVAQVQQGASILAVSGSFTGNSLSLGTCIAESLRRFFSLFGYALIVGLLVMVGVFTLGIMSFVWMTMYSVGPCAIVIERMRATPAMARSKELTHGHKWSIFGIIIVLGLLIGVVSGGIETMVVGTGMPSAGQSVLLFFINTLISLPQIVAVVAIYFDLRVRKEAFDVEQLSSLVDAIAARGGAETISEDEGTSGGAGV